MKKTFKTILLSILALTFTLFICSCSDEDIENSMNQINNVLQSQDSYVLTIQNATMGETEYTYKEVFDNFFAYPTWTHFTSPEGEEVVELTGDCFYQDVEVKALVQFVITEETDEYMTWDTTFLSFNDVPQNVLMLSELFETAIDSYAEKIQLQ